jgi:hypothetical protein
VESSGHPDLVHIGRVLRERMDRTLEAEMVAARAAARRTRAMRDILLAIEDRGTRVLLSAADGSTHAGVITAVGKDHVELAHAARRRLLSLRHIVSLEER